MKRLHSAGYLMNHIARQFAILLSEGLKPLGISPAQFPILLTLWEQDGLSQQELVEIADLKQATIANTLSRMERDGLIVRKDNPNDARSRLIFLSETAKSLQAQATRIAQNINREALSELSADEQTAFLNMLGKVVEQQKKMIGGA
ncbi:MarR family transcriptional regulator [Neisseria sp. ZJ106]|uniref:MarR family transcriptional regulator n=1 Tax=Neisseria lisongii TaxID=2912188 RepID=A0AAW5AM33_9NEIS|nr:MarR family transcriptional regulator [Neisseria lisongii]MCF7522093.1 MarR family transcriptional regulator [Neisseria lisongii]MCF7530561.1 MarR family transcriptional regulator [Neisseria lisongii]WCL71379.1 MarR family transcriptional regulator [Neisseria lisongii]